MGKYQVMLKPKAERDLLIIKKSGNKAVINKIQQIFKELANIYSSSSSSELSEDPLNIFLTISIFF